MRFLAQIRVSGSARAALLSHTDRRRTAMAQKQKGYADPSRIGDHAMQVEESESHTPLPGWCNSASVAAHIEPGSSLDRAWMAA